MHVHVQHWDYFVLLEGHISVGLRDLRRGSPTEHATACVEIDAREPTVLVIPPRVLHGFYGRERSVWVYGLSHYFNPADELGCRWDDPALQIPWRVESPVLSQRDATAPTLAVLLEQLAQRMPG
jgi:dTDP-4-dehydrorhamnose 3,5-epimerase